MAIINLVLTILIPLALRRATVVPPWDFCIVWTYRLTLYSVLLATVQVVGLGLAIFVAWVHQESSE